MKQIIYTLISLILISSDIALGNTPIKRYTHTTAPYAIGDYYNENGFEGVVFMVSEDGKSGTIISLTETKGVRQWASTTEAQRHYTNADSTDDGMANFRAIKEFEQWQKHFPAFAWCASLGEGWYLPAIHELREVTFNPPVYTKVQATLKALDATPLPEKGKWFDYWSSTEIDVRYASGENCVWGVNMQNGATKDNGKSRYATVRAVAKFPYTPQEEDSTHNNANHTTPPYSIGDLFNNGAMRGVVIEIDEQGTHGKIISLRQPDNKLPWAYGNACQSLVGADNRADGMINMSHIRTIDDWEQQYPAFAWCASLGDNWYLPAIDELSALLANQTLINSINKTLEELLAPQIHTHGSWNDFWSSTESPTVYIPDEEYEAELTTNAYGFFFFDNKEHEVSKGGDLGVRAFAKF